MSETEGTYILPPVVFDWMQDAAKCLLGVDGDESQVLLARLRDMQYATAASRGAPAAPSVGAEPLTALQGGASSEGPDE